MQRPLLILAVSDGLCEYSCHGVVMAAIIFIIDIIHAVLVLTTAFLIVSLKQYSSYGSTASSTCASTINISCILNLH